MAFQPNHHSYTDLNTILSILDTNLKIATTVELHRKSRRSAPEIADSIHNADRKGFMQERQEKAPRKRVEAVKKTLDEMAQGANGEILLGRYELGKKAFHMPEALYDFLNTRLVAPTIDIAYLALQLISQTQTPAHHFWGTEGGSYSSTLKHLQTGIPLAFFYGVKPLEILPSVDSNHWDRAMPTRLSSKEFESAFQLTDSERKTLVHKLKGYGFIQRKENISGNAWKYALTQKGQKFVEDFFIPSLHRTKHLSGSKVHWKIHEAKNIVRDYHRAITTLRNTHYQAFENQFTE